MTQPWLPGGASTKAARTGSRWNTPSVDSPPPPVVSGIKAYDGTSWVLHPVKVWNGTAWAAHPLKYWDGSQWALAGA